MEDFFEEISRIEVQMEGSSEEISRIEVQMEGSSEEISRIEVQKYKIFENPKFWRKFQNFKMAISTISTRPKFKVSKEIQKIVEFHHFFPRLGGPIV